MRTLFIGGTRRGYMTLQALVEIGADLVGVVSLQQDAHETDRFESSIRELCREIDVPCYETKWMNDKDYARILAEELRPDIAFVVGCRVLIRPSIYSMPRLGTLAVHDSLLPEYRGFAPTNWAIMNGLDETGVTLFYLNESIDEGDIVAQRRVAIPPHEDAAQVYDRICTATVEVIRETYPALLAGTSARIRQHGSGGSYTCSRTPADGLIDWSQSTTSVYNLVRALARPYPGAYTYLDSDKMIVWRAEPVSDAPRYVGRIPGRVVGIDRESGTVDVLTGDGILRIHRVQMQGAPDDAPAAEVIRSVRTSLGLSVEHLLARVVHLEYRIEELQRSVPSAAYQD